MRFRLHLQGRVQGVGFRPYVHRFALERGLNGHVENAPDGVHLCFGAPDLSRAQSLAFALLEGVPTQAQVERWQLLPEPNLPLSEGFAIRQSADCDTAPDLLLSPDFALCPRCRQEMSDPANRRHAYPFLTCTDCGPRYSILERLPYERHWTSMRHFALCPECSKEYATPADRRYFSQTNACPTCGPHLYWRTPALQQPCTSAQVLPLLLQCLQEGGILAVKAVGGFLLLCDAANATAVQTLRLRKGRPHKPFALLFPDLSKLQQVAQVSAVARAHLEGPVGPVVLLPALPQAWERLAMDVLAPGLRTIGAMLPHAPILEWLAQGWQAPLLATSANPAGGSIPSGFSEELFTLADAVLDHDRPICMPQDDSVLRLEGEHPVWLRRGRGLAPALQPACSLPVDGCLLAMGASMKGSLAWQQGKRVYHSQYLGNLYGYDSAQRLLQVHTHFGRLLGGRPQAVICDLHPDDAAARIGQELARQQGLPLLGVQHHRAHFAALLGECGLLQERVLGLVWDGMGMGEDGQVWGGECFLSQPTDTGLRMERCYWLEPLPLLAGDRMAREPRLSALAAFGPLSELRPLFSEKEWEVYGKLREQSQVGSSSAGRYFEAAAALLGGPPRQSYEGQAALWLEQLAGSGLPAKEGLFAEQIAPGPLPMYPWLQRWRQLKQQGAEPMLLAALFHATLAQLVCLLARRQGVRHVGLSGGVFQNALLRALIRQALEADGIRLHTHRQLPAGDENIAFGQLVYAQYFNPIPL